MFWKKNRQLIQPEWLVVGLGNPGGQYDGTRHNVGFEVIHRFAKRHRINVNHRKHKAVYGIGKIGKDGIPVLIARPMTYMNLSGSAVSSLMHAYQIPPERIIVVYDDMDLEVGRVRIKPKGGAGSHNGMANIIASLHTEDFPRVRIGIGSPAWSGADHVLGKFEGDEIPIILDALERATDGCELIITQGIDKAMNTINTSEKD